jgi:hypothetical protein
VGEIRGVEANISFQVMQTGYPVMSTFPAAQMSSLIQRLTGEPMRIPKPNVENLNIALFQAAVQGKDGKPIRRVLSINEIFGYNGAADSDFYSCVYLGSRNRYCFVQWKRQQYIICIQALGQTWPCMKGRGRPARRIGVACQDPGNDDSEKDIPVL